MATETKEKRKGAEEQVQVKWYGYIALLVGILFFSGLFQKAPGAALFPFIGDLAIWKPLVLIIVLKFVGANAMRFCVNKMDKKEEA